MTARMSAAVFLNPAFFKTAESVLARTTWSFSRNICRQVTRFAWGISQHPRPYLVTISPCPYVVTHISKSIGSRPAAASEAT
jgi:hypothetical protein